MSKMLVPLSFQFQFLYGAIKVANRRSVRVCFPRFQFLYGAIKVRKRSLRLVTNDYFNSCMVRLRSALAVAIASWFVYFNSCMVRLRCLQLLLLHKVNFHFNSCMVRLRLSLTAVTACVLSLFQFLYGAIKVAV